MYKIKQSLQNIIKIQRKSITSFLQGKLSLNLSMIFWKIISVLSWRWCWIIDLIGTGVGNNSGADPRGGGGRTRHMPPSLKNWKKKMIFFCIKSWFFTRNTPKIFVPPSTWRDFFKCTPPNLKSWIRPCNYPRNDPHSYIYQWASNTHPCVHGQSSSWSDGYWIYSYLCNQCLSPLKLRVWIPLMARCTRYNIMW